jgi:hypothetical protein
VPFTVDQLFARARLPLNDADKVRHFDSEFRVYALEALQLIRKRRPDLFIGALLKPVELPDPGDGTVPIDDAYMQSMADYITARVQMKDGDATGAKAAELLAMAMGAVT